MGKFCRRCGKKKAGLNGIVVACYYQEGPLREAIHEFKYRSLLELKDFLSGLMVDAFKENFRPKKEFVIMPVPMHWQEKLKRGYNQAEILARVVAQKLAISFSDGLIKNRRTKRQVEVRGKIRASNLKDSFILKGKIRLRQKEIILIDDITTTGATLKECAQILKNAGAKKVWGLVLAK